MVTRRKVVVTLGACAATPGARAALKVTSAVKGTKPGDIPIEQATKFDLIINMKTAKALGLKIPQSILVQATKVIE